MADLPPSSEEVSRGASMQSEMYKPTTTFKNNKQARLETELNLSTLKKENRADRTIDTLMGSQRVSEPILFPSTS